jgi:hypothetical protein
MAGKSDKKCAGKIQHLNKGRAVGTPDPRPTNLNLRLDVLGFGRTVSAELRAGEMDFSPSTRTFSRR